MLVFRLVSDNRGTFGNETIFVDPEQVACVREYQDRHAYPGCFNDTEYSGYFPATEITLRSGKSIKVHGHVAKAVIRDDDPC